MRMRSPDLCAQVQAIIASLYDVPVAVGVTDLRQKQPAPLGQEAAHLSRAFPTRKNEFAAGRAAARIGLAQLGYKATAIPAAPDRAPVWPAQIHGSISHTAQLCAAVVTDTNVSLGLDIEENTDLAQGLLSTICSDDELERIAGPDHLRLAKLVFSAKEAVYKAQYPLTGLLFGFDHIDIEFDFSRQSFVATFLKPAGAFAIGDCMAGRFDGVADHLVTAVHTAIR